MKISKRLFDEYLVYRDNMDRKVKEPYNWKDEDLMEFFRQELWERAKPEDEVDGAYWEDLDYPTWLQFDRVYQRLKKSGRLKRILRAVTQKHNK